MECCIKILLPIQTKQKYNTQIAQFVLKMSENLGALLTKCDDRFRIIL